METNYTMIGADGLQYGPVNLGQARTWIGEGRITAETQILRNDTNAWLPASQYAELGLAQSHALPQMGGPAVAVAAPATVAVADPVLLRRVRSGAGWFFVIAVFSVINTFIFRSGGSFFLIGLGVNLMVPSVPANIITAGIFALFGVFARKGHAWSFIVGMVLYALDALIFLQAQFWLPLAFHAYALFWIFLGLQASIRLKSQNR